MEELKAKVKELKELKEKLVCGAKEAFDKGIQTINTSEMGEVIDMIKDLAEAEEKCYKAHYYKMMVENLHEGKERKKMMAEMGMQQGQGQQEQERMGYDNWRFSSGRFAPTGRGHYDPSGYMPGEEIEPWMMAEGFGGNPMGYSGSSGGGRGSSSSSGGSRGGSYSGSSGGGRGGSSGGSSSGSSSGGSSGGSSGSSGGSYGYNGRMGYSGSERGDRYDRYNEARMGYHESKDAASKQHMDTTAREYVVDMAESLKEVWKEADPAMRKEIKEKFVALTSQMG